MLRTRIIGRGRAGSALAAALRAAGCDVDGPLGRGDDVADAAGDVDLLILAVDDRAVAGVAATVRPVDSTVVAHLSGVLGLDVLAPHRRVASVHPLVSLPDADVGAQRLRGAWFAVDGDDVVREVVAALGGKAVEVAATDRVRYHAAAVMAANHVVALLGEVERVAATTGLPLDAYLDLVRGAVENVATLGPRAALTGPVARGDLDTVRRHLDALDEPAGEVYAALSRAAARLLEDST